ncbi:NADH-ubiquinone/plastoquinone complex I subunit [Leptospira broomii serovar Hurstbridge str. 5399]|uniref:NADH-ubiquinone/plastoquinone complex I subunit n=1 Tax=Leptospira broomii serovar Hurstbridge str. 5399 TaxID=1049789 RepID=T0G908_9LEPT|nr:proton-conducting transporter membrane subunit [Leptospira broomii]EQA43309.1 NADH-ubiquinone/plastoquinone complex I subunit [Leptospira broomii serovar Hurstbridge str. 5399]
MSLEILYGIGFAVFILIFLTYVLAPTRNQSDLPFWSVLLILCAGLNFAAWGERDTTLQWVLIEATTFVGSLLISSSRTSKSFPIAWKFLLINSFGLGIAFLGIVLILAAFHVINQPVEVLAANVSDHPEIIWVEVGLWLAIFGYTAKLGLFPNHVWIEDTYGESPTQVSSLLSAFIPVSVCFALRPFVHMDHQLFPHTFSGADGLLVLGIVTILISIFAVYDRNDIRRISAKAALFHIGALAVILWMDLSDVVFYFVMASNLVVKSLLFISMGIVRMDAGKRELGKILQSDSINKPALSLFILALFLAFVMPGSPVFVNDIILIKAGQIGGKGLVILVPILGLVFFGVMLYKIAPLLNLKGRPFQKENSTILRIRMTNGFFLLLLLLGTGCWGFFLLVQGVL